MKLTPFSCLIAALYSALHVLAGGIQALPVAIVESDNPVPTNPTVLNGHEAQAHPHIEVRQGAAVADPAPTRNPEQAPTVSSQWVETTIAGTSTWVEIQYTQTFASVPDQWPTAGSGEIGYGTLTKEKRDVHVARETGIAGRMRV